MIDEKVIEQALAAFTVAYNPEQSLTVAKSRSINAALQRNPTYPPDFGYEERKKVRSAWSEMLDDVVTRRLFLCDEKEFVSVAMNYRNDLKKSAPTARFKLSHAQKSFSLYAKHCWALGKISEPRVCPVDRMILVAAGAPPSIQTWTSVDSEANYLSQFDFIKKAAKRAGTTVSQWELISFPPTK